MKLRVLAIAIFFTVKIAHGDDVAVPLSNPQAVLLSRVKFEQQLGQQMPLDVSLRDDFGNDVMLKEYFHSRPVVLVLAYYRCPMLCNQVLRGLATSLRAVNLRAGSDFEVVVVSFDPSDNTELAAAKKAAVLEQYGHADQASGWHFLTGSKEATARLAHRIGFNFEYDPATNQFAHASGIVVVTPEGTLSRYFYGIDFLTRDLRLALVEASANQIGSPVDQVLLFCFHYDPSTGRYGLAIMRLIRVTGIATVLVLGGFIFLSLRRERRLANQSLATES